jgi:hypothetical protein
MQHMLCRAVWDADGVREYVVEYLYDGAAVLVVDETGDVSGLDPVCGTHDRKRLFECATLDVNIEAFAKIYSTKFPKAVAKITDDRDELLAFWCSSWSSPLRRAGARSPAPT